MVSRVERLLRRTAAGPAAFWALFAVAALARLGLLDRHGLWADEFFSLAMATGHSLEHPAARAEPALGDFVEARGPLPPSAYSRYLRHETPPAGLGRVLRASLLSDTSPPLYYLLLYGWTRVLGTGDFALRLFSVAAALACFPVLWSLARQVGGRAAALPACALFALSPHAVFYAAEGRMYALLWLWCVCALWLTLRLAQRDVRGWMLPAWAAVGGAGLLTHYFFVFVWAAACLWLWLRPGKWRRWHVVAAAAASGLFALPWYARLPESLASWRVTHDWLTVRPEGFRLALAALGLPWSFVSASGHWGGRPWLEYVNLAAYLTLAVLAVVRLGRVLCTPRRQLLWLWVLAACLGPVVFDVWRGTYVVAVPRYALAGMPAAFLLAGSCLGRLRPRPRAVFLVLLTAVYLIGVRRIYLNETRHHEPTRQLGRLLAEKGRAGDLVILHSIPSGVVGVSRYMEEYGAPAGVDVLAWVGQLRQRTPDELREHAAGRARVILVKVHEVGEPVPQEEWLRRHAVAADERRIASATVTYFLPRGTDTFFPGEAGRP